MSYIKFDKVNITKNKIKKLKNISFEINQGDFVIIIGPSNSGKSLILNALAKNEKLDSGNIYVNDILINSLNSRKTSKYKREIISFSYNDDEMIKALNVKENIQLGLELSKEKINIDEFLKKLGILKNKNSFYNELSYEIQKKVTILRAVSKNTAIFLGDNILNCFNEKDKIMILKFLKSLCKKNNKTVIITSDNEDINLIFNKVIKIKNGTIKEIIINKKPKAIGDLKC